jgi:uncharacterized repeat protein (TIGR01451 family)
MLRSFRRATIVVALSASFLSAGTASASAASPWWQLTNTVRPSNLPPGGEGTITIKAVNIGDAPTTGTIRLTDTLPPGLKVASTKNPGGEDVPNIRYVAFSLNVGQLDLGTAGFLGFLNLCKAAGNTVTCEGPEFLQPLQPFEDLEMQIGVTAEGASSGEENHAEVTGGGVEPAAVKRRLTVSEEPTPFGVEEFSMIPEEEGGAVDTQAGSHPFQFTTLLSLNQDKNAAVPPALARNLQFQLPAGLIGNTKAVPRCSDLDFRRQVPGGTANLCPADTVLGAASLTIDEPITFGLTTLPVPLFNLAPAEGEPARFGFEFAGTAVTLDTSVRTGRDYGVAVSVTNITQLTSFLSSTVTIWGTPGDERHNSARGWNCLVSGHFTTGTCLPGGESEPPPFLTLPTSCATPFTAAVTGSAWPSKASPEGQALAPGSYSLADSSGRELGLDGCNRLEFAPTIQVEPEKHTTSIPTGLAVKVHVPQEVSENASGLASSSVKDIDVTLPEGVMLNPAGADGLEACSEAQSGFTGFSPLNPAIEPRVKTAQFTPTLPSPFCPTASKVGTVKIKTPLLTNPLEGAVYLATQNENPFGSLVAMYIVAEDPESGVLVKLPGEVALNGATGQVAASFKNNPQLPFEDAELHFFGGERGPLATPARCGTYTTEAAFAPWSGNPPVTPSSSFEITSGPNGGPCPGASLPFAPLLAAGMTNIQAGAFSPLTTTISREDGNQDIQTVQLHMPPGLSGILAGIPLCPEAQANAGTCSKASEIGTTIVSVGLGGDPFTVTGGQVFLTEKYKGAPFGLSIVNPAKAGPFDLGKVIVRAKIEVDPHTAVLTVTTDQIPHILDGIPLQIKHVNVTIDRPGFTFNPTNCSAFKLTGSIGGVEGVTAPVETPFQITNCANLKFAPKLTVSTAGKTSKANGASLKVKLSVPHEGPQVTTNGSSASGASASAQTEEANIAKVKVELPKALPSQLKTLQKACTSAQFDSNPAGCPAASVVGMAVARTPVLSNPLTGPAYFVSRGNEAFPQLIVVLRGEGVTVDLVGDTFISKAGITSSTFGFVPDVPVSSFELTLPQGKYSALAANGNLCAEKLAMPTEFVAQNGTVIHESTPIAVEGCPNSISVVSHSLNARNLTVSVSVPAAGKLAAAGKGLSKASKTSKGRETIKLTLHTTKSGKLSTKVKLTFTPSTGKDRRKLTKSLAVKFKK